MSSSSLIDTTDKPITLPNLPADDGENDIMSKALASAPCTPLSDENIDNATVLHQQMVSQFIQPDLYIPALICLEDGVIKMGKLKVYTSYGDTVLHSILMSAEHLFEVPLEQLAELTFITINEDRQMMELLQSPQTKPDNIGLVHLSFLHSQQVKDYPWMLQWIEKFDVEPDTP